MRIAALYDIHGNAPALEAVLRDVRAFHVDHVVVGGDVLPGPMPRETLALLFALDIPATFIAGNGEVAVLAEREGRVCAVPAPYRPAIQWVAAAVSDEDADRIATWPKTARLGDVLFCHATPRSEDEIFTRATDDSRLRPIFDAAGAPLVVCGHTHMQFDRTIGGVRVVNAGSVGMAFGEPGAHWLVLDAGIDLRRTSYDRAAAAVRVRATAYPGASEFADRSILDPPTAAEMIAAFSNVELST